MDKNSVKKIKYGKKPVHKYLRSGHYHVVVNEYDDKYVSVGLTSDNPDNKRNQQLHKVYESNGKIARMKRSATVDSKSFYKKKKAGFHIDEESEKKAIIIGNNKMAKKK